MSASTRKPVLRVVTREQSATTSSQADASDLARVAAGDLGALGGVYDRHATTVLAFLHRAAGASDAEDVLQMTFVRAARAAATFDVARGTARAWLLGIAARLVMERRRSLFRQARLLLGFEATVQGRFARASDGDRLDIAAALDALPPEKRVVVVLSEVEGYTCEEIARMLDVPIGTVWTRLHHARKQLRAWFDGGEEA